jgi:hypothetical protein
MLMFNPGCLSLNVIIKQTLDLFALEFSPILIETPLVWVRKLEQVL